MNNGNGEAAELAERAANQGKHAARNAGKAAKVVGENVIEHVVEEAHDAVEKFEGTAEDLNDVLSRVNSRANRIVAKHLGMGAVAIGVSVAAASIGIKHILYARGFDKGTAEAMTDIVEEHTRAII